MAPRTGSSHGGGGRGGSEARRRRRPGRPGRSLLFIFLRRYGIFIVIGAVIIAAIATTGSPRILAGGEATVRVPGGTSAGQIASLLSDSGVIASKDDFMRAADDTGASGKLKAGVYRFQRGEPVQNIIFDLESGRQASEGKLTIPEGYSDADIAKLVSLRTPVSASEYLAASTASGKLLPLAGAEGAGTLEGFLFPSTYSLDAGANAASLVSRQLAAFREQTARLDWSGAAHVRTAPANLTPYQILIVASMIEREAKVPEERPLVAAVIYNRLASGMKLEVDATVQYALGYWKDGLTKQDLEIRSPFNTRLFSGLPPAPICNPGLASMQAALTPAKVDYLYYVATGDAAGHHFFTDNYQEFLRRVNSPG
ncbi:MAG: endolytic transglycosylase MltG [Actinobacteria bacterium]|nr:endolytic transglycosylase MltG [Actinomycetota bacterium]